MTNLSALVLLVGGSAHGQTATVSSVSHEIEREGVAYLPHSGLRYGQLELGVEGVLIAEAAAPRGSLVPLVVVHGSAWIMHKIQCLAHVSA